MSWLRFDALTFQDKHVRRSGRSGRLVFIAALTMTKAHAWQSRNEERGFLPEDDFTPEEIAVWYAEGGSEEAVKFYEIGLLACLKEGLLVRCSNTPGYLVPNWRRYQPDPTSAERTARYERKQREKKRSPHREAREEPAKPRYGEPPQRLTGSTVTHEDVTGRDVTKSTSTSPSPRTVAAAPEPGGDGGSGLGASAAPPSGVGGSNGNGHAPTAPPNGHPTIAAIRAELAGRALPRALTDAERTAHAERVRAQAAALAAGDPPCPATDPETTAATSRPTTAPPPNAGSPTSTPTEASAASAP